MLFFMIQCLVYLDCMSLQELFWKCLLITDDLNSKSSFVMGLLYATNSYTDCISHEIPLGCLGRVKTQPLTTLWLFCCIKILTVAFVTGSWSLQRDFSIRRGTFWHQSERVKEHKIEIVQSNKTTFFTVETLKLFYFFKCIFNHFIRWFRHFSW